MLVAGCRIIGELYGILYRERGVLLQHMKISMSPNLGTMK